MEKNFNRPWTPSPWNLEPCTFGKSGSFFKENSMVTLKMLQLFQNEEIMGQSPKCFEFFLTNKFFWWHCRKMKRRESSETRSPQVWGRSEPSLGGKRPVKNLENFGRYHHLGPKISKLAKMTTYFLEYPGGPDDKATYHPESTIIVRIFAIIRRYLQACPRVTLHPWFVRFVRFFCFHFVCERRWRINGSWCTMSCGSCP